MQRDAESAIRFLEAEEDRFELILLDPPYQAGNHASLMKKLPSLVKPGGLVILEHHHKTELADSYDGLNKVREVRAGESCLSFFEAST